MRQLVAMQVTRGQAAGGESSRTPGTVRKYRRVADGRAVTVLAQLRDNSKPNLTDRL